MGTLASEWITCLPCKKRLYFTRPDAKAAVRALHDKSMREYMCPGGSDGWHVGHLPTAARRGAMSAEDYYRGS